MLDLASLVDVTTRMMNQTSWQVGAMNAGLRSRAIATWRFCTEPTVHLYRTDTTHCVSKNDSQHYRLKIKQRLLELDNFSYEYFRHNWPSNDPLIFHLPQRPLLRYPEKAEPTKYYIFNEGNIIRPT